MPEYPFIPRIFPLGVILLDFLFLTVAIPIEAYILHNRLKFDKKTSIFYSICMNLFSSVIGWIVFFVADSVLPVIYTSEFINYLFFNRLQYEYNIQTLIVLTAFIIFFANFLLKYLLLRVLLISLSEPGKNEPEPLIRRNSRRNYKNKLQTSNLITSLLIANALSYSVIVIILFIRAAYV